MIKLKKINLLSLSVAPFSLGLQGQVEVISLLSPLENLGLPLSFQYFLLQPPFLFPALASQSCFEETEKIEKSHNSPKKIGSKVEVQRGIKSTKVSLLSEKLISKANKLPLPFACHCVTGPFPNFSCRAFQLLLGCWIHNPQSSPVPRGHLPFPRSKGSVSQVCVFVHYLQERGSLYVHKLLVH